jgi:hypothetical protein
MSILAARTVPARAVSTVDGAVLEKARPVGQRAVRLAE